MKIRPFNLTRSLVNRQAYSQAYINRPFQTLSTTLGSHLLGRAAQKKDLPLLPELLGRAAQVPGPGQESSTPFSHVNAAQTSASRWKHPCQSQQPFIVQNHGLRVRLPQASHALTGDLVANGVGIALQRYTAQPNAHLHGGAGVIYKQSFYDWYKQGNQCDWYKQSCQCMIQI